MLFPQTDRSISFLALLASYLGLPPLGRLNAPTEPLGHRLTILNPARFAPLSEIVTRVEGRVAEAKVAYGSRSGAIDDILETGVRGQRRRRELIRGGQIPVW